MNAQKNINNVHNCINLYITTLAIWVVQKIIPYQFSQAFQYDMNININFVLQVGQKSAYIYGP